jgi:APA family basic amino acid/polyamine antiporter
MAFDFPKTSEASGLRKTVGLTMLTLYGIGVTVGAGIFVLVGQIAFQARDGAPISLILGALSVVFTAFSFAELASRFPRAAGEAVYVQEAFGVRSWALIVGLLVCLAGIVSTATIVNGTRAYAQELTFLSDWSIEAIIVAAMVAIAAWGVTQSMAVTALITCTEIGTLLVVMAVGGVSIAEGSPNLRPFGSEMPVQGILAAVLPCVFAFIGFENMVNMAEEVKTPRRTIPLAIIITLVVVTTLYIGITVIALRLVDPSHLGEAEAPLVLVFEAATGKSADAIAVLASFATINGILAQIVMVSRVLYGLGQTGLLPRRLADINPRTRTPVLSTLICGGCVILFAWFLPVDLLARLASVGILIIFAAVNSALLALKIRGAPDPNHTFSVPNWVPVAGLVGSLLPLLWELLILVRSAF